MFHNKTMNTARGKWRGILLSIGMPESFLQNRHGPCPLCGGTDRFRWDNKDGAGTYICNQCGAGDGMNLAMKYTGQTFVEVARAIDGMLGGLKAEVPRPETNYEQRRRLLRETYKATIAVQPGDTVHKYLATRGVEELVYQEALRFAPRLQDGDGGIRPAMVAMVVGPDGVPVTLHRTFLKPDGSGKAEMAAPRKLMPGPLPEGACVRLCDYVPGGPLGIAEGIETALSASALHELPVWAALNATGLKRWQPPDGCKEVAIFGDNDTGFVGQTAAYELAQRLCSNGNHVTVHLPEQAGDDWNDVHLHRLASKQDST